MFMFNFTPKIPEISADEVKKSLDNHEKAILLDVRTPDEYSREKIKGSINIPLNELSEKIEEYISDKNQLTYVYCRSGSRSSYATNIMRKMGYTNVFNMANGLLAWHVKQYPLES